MSIIVLLMESLLNQANFGPFQRSGKVKYICLEIFARARLIYVFTDKSLLQTSSYLTYFIN